MCIWWDIYQPLFYLLDCVLVLLATSLFDKFDLFLSVDFFSKASDFFAGDVIYSLSEDVFLVFDVLLLW